MGNPQESELKMSITIAVFVKKGNATFYLKKYVGTEKEILKQMKDGGEWNAQKAFLSEDKSYAHNTQEQEGGCTFLVFDQKKADQLIKDIDWIANVKAFAKEKYGLDGHYYIAVVRMKREGKDWKNSKALQKLREKYGDVEIHDHPVSLEFIEEKERALAKEIARKEAIVAEEKQKEQKILESLDSDKVGKYWKFCRTMDDTQSIVYQNTHGTVDYGKACSAYQKNVAAEKEALGLFSEEERRILNIDVRQVHFNIFGLELTKGFKKYLRGKEAIK